MDTAREQILEDWIRKYGDSILRTCFVCLSDVREAEDAMQETFIKAWRAMDRFEHRNGAGEKTWLTHIAVNVCRDIRRTRWFRHVDMRRALDEIPQEMSSVLPEDRDLLLDIMQLPDKYRTAVHLFYYEGYSVEEIGKMTDTNPSTVKSHLHRAREALRGMLKEDEPDV